MLSEWELILLPHVFQVFWQGQKHKSTFLAGLLWCCGLPGRETVSCKVPASLEDTTDFSGPSSARSHLSHTQEPARVREPQKYKGLLLLCILSCSLSPFLLHSLVSNACQILHLSTESLPQRWQTWINVSAEVTTFKERAKTPYFIVSVWEGKR